MEELNIENVLLPDEIETLFSGGAQEQEETTGNPSPEKEEKKETTEEVDTENLFPESVGSEEKETKEKEDTTPEGDGTSPKTDFYSSIAKALKEDGIFPDLDDDIINGIKDPEGFADAIKKQISAGLDETQKRVNDALEVGVDPNAVQYFERAISQMEDIKEEDITNEETGENLRKQLILRDFMNKGYSKERAEREVKKSLDAGTDVEDAKESLEEIKKYLHKQYDDLIKEAQEEARKDEEQRKKDIEDLKNSMLDDKDVFGDLKVDKATRQKALDAVSKPVWKDPETGDYYTALQKYEKENKLDFLKYVGLIFTLTDSFKSLDGLVKEKQKKEARKGISALEKVINSTQRSSDGNLEYVTGVNDKESYLGKFTLDI